MAKTKHVPMTDETLLASLATEKSTADYQGVNILTYQREQADRQYAGQATDGLEAFTGMSSVIINATRPVVTTLTTYLSKIFCADKDTVVFTPTDPRLSPVAKQAMKIVNHVIHKENNGYNVLNGAARDAALHKNAVAKVTWDETPVVKFKEFTDMSEDEIDAVMVELEEMGGTVSIDEKDEDTGSYTIRCEYPRGLPHIELLPPEEFLINEGAARINDNNGITRYVAHRKIMHTGDIQAMSDNMGWDQDIYALAAATGGDTLDHEYETLNRHASDGTYNYISEGSGEGALRQLELTESWIKGDLEGTGKTVWIHTFTIGNNLLFKEEWSGPLPFASFCYFPIEHKFYGLSVWDILKDYHRTMTGLYRSEVDMRVQQNSFRIIADPRFVDARILQSGRPGVVPARPGFDPSHVMTIPTPSGSPNTIQLIEELWKQVEREIGINPLTGAISSDVEKSGNDAAKTSMVIDNASAKVEEYSRRFAEDFVKEIIWLVYDLLITNSDKTTVKALVNKVTPDMPQFLAGELPLDKASLSAKVGLGHLTTQQKVTALNAIKIMQQEMEAINPGAIPVDKKLGLAYEMTKALGYENVYDFLPTPEEAQASIQAAAEAAQQQQPDPLLQLQAAKMQAETKKIESETAENIVDAEVKGRKQSLEEQATAAEIAIEMQQGRGAEIG